ncbi:MAG: GNAT family N-acetyltransferase [Victivallales bacterium]|nr:GNAT family N-acetyltransferase [Victivallales bacterium]
MDGIRPAQPGDSDFLAELAVMASGGLIPAVLGDLATGWTPAAMLALLLRMENDTYSWRNAVVAEAGGQPVGMALAYPALNAMVRGGVTAETSAHRELMRPFQELSDHESYYLCSLAVLPSRRGGGIGAALLAAVAGQAREQGYPALTLHVLARNHRAVAFYRRNGFVPRGAHPMPVHSRLEFSGPVLLLSRPLSPRVRVRTEKQSCRNGGPPDEG